MALSERRALLRRHLKRAGAAILYSDHMEGDEGEAMFRHACRLGLEGIVSKRATSPTNPAGATLGGRSRTRVTSGSELASERERALFLGITVLISVIVAAATFCGPTVASGKC